VSVEALAIGGDGGPPQNPQSFPWATGDGGSARSSALAHGAGEVSARASSVTGFAGFLETSALATATAEGAAGSAVAEAVARSGSIGALSARAGSSVAGASVVEARASMRQPAAGSVPPRDSFATVTGLPSAQVVADALLGNDLLSALVAGGDVEDELALARWSAGATGETRGESIWLHSEFSLLLDRSEPDDPFEIFVPPQLSAPSGLFLGLLNPEIADGGFDTLRFLIEKDGQTLLDRVFTDPAEALLFFDDQALDLGDLSPTSIVRLRLELAASDASAGFAADFLVVQGTVPEPSTWLLVGVGIAWLAVRRRRSR
jgi:hypothetical protein